MSPRHTALVLTGALALVTALPVAAAAPADNTAGTYYLGGTLSQLDYKLTGAPSLNPKAIAFLAGYNFNRNFSGEVRGGFGVASETVSGNGASLELKAQSQLSVFARGNLPVSDTFSFYALAGYSELRTEVTASGAVSGTGSGSDSGFSYGAGIDVKFGGASRSSLLVEYTRLVSTSDFDIDALTIGFRYSMN